MPAQEPIDTRTNEPPGDKAKWSYIRLFTNIATTYYPASENDPGHALSSLIVC